MREGEGGFGGTYVWFGGLVGLGADPLGVGMVRVAIGGGLLDVRGSDSLLREREKEGGDIVSAGRCMELQFSF